MSDDLISRKALLMQISKAIGHEDDSTITFSIREIKDIVREQPTVFDREKVIEELNSERNLMYREDGTLMGARTQISIDRAVDIVEKGGVE